MMTSFEKKLTQYIESVDDDIKLHQAPDISNEIWHRHKLSKFKRYAAMAASVSLVVLSSLIYQGSDKPIELSSSGQQLLAENALLEQKLLEVSKNTVSEKQSIVITNWYQQLAVIDQSIELQNVEYFDKEKWSSRKELLTKIIAFYDQPIEFYEI